MPDEMPETVEAGRAARRAGIKAKDCPFAFINTPCYPWQHQRFHHEFRPALDAWMRGWIAEDRAMRHGERKVK